MKNNIFICPETHSKLTQIKHGGKYALINENEKLYQIISAIPDLTYPEIDGQFLNIKDFYDKRVEQYEKNLYCTFKTHNIDEIETRESFISLLNLKPDSKVLEIACGTGRDSVLIAKSLSKRGELHLTDISLQMILFCKSKLLPYNIKKSFCISNAINLPYPDKYFDSVYSFGGLGEFGDIKKSLAEMVRVTKIGGKIVVGDESMPPWLRDTYFAKVLTTTNPQFNAHIPLNEIPVEAREVCLRWVIGGVFYLIDFKVGEGEPLANFDFIIPGERGGTLRTRFEGQLEGVSKETKEIAWKIVRKKESNMYDWLDKVVKSAAIKELNELKKMD